MEARLGLSVKALGVIGMALVTLLLTPQSGEAGSEFSVCYQCTPYIMCPSEAELRAFCIGAGCPYEYPGCTDEGVPSCPDNAFIGCNSGP
jgi:hypothetical protein